MSAIEKKWWKSKLIRVGALSVGIAVLEAIMGGATWKAAAFAGIGALILILRPMTDTKLIK